MPEQTRREFLAAAGALTTQTLAISGGQEHHSSPGGARLRATRRSRRIGRSRSRASMFIPTA